MRRPSLLVAQCAAVFLLAYAWPLPTAAPIDPASQIAVSLAETDPSPPEDVSGTAPRPAPTIIPEPTPTTAPPGPSPTPVAASEASPDASPAARERTGEVRLMAVGDVMLARTIGERIERRGAALPFRWVVDTFAQADLVVANLESPISDRGSAAQKSFTFRAPLAAADSLAEAGIDVVSLANNHALDYGPAALRQTIELLETRGIGHAGAGEDSAAARAPLIVERNGLRLAFLGYVARMWERTGFNTGRWEATADQAGVAIARPRDVRRDVAAAREQADIVVVMLHAGHEYRARPVGAQRNVAQAALEAGAALVIGHHPHVLQGYQLGPGTLVAYSLGNFVFDGFSGSSNHSVILDVTLTAEGVTEVRWIPVVIRRGLPRLAGERAAARILERLPELPAQP